MKEKATTDPAQIAQWKRLFPGCNWGLWLAPDFVCVDVDPDGADHWDGLVWQNGEIETLRALSGRGRHYVFRAKLGAKYVGALETGIDVKHNGYILICPSVHKNGIPYRWVNKFSTLSDVPCWLAELIEKRIPEAPPVPQEHDERDVMTAVEAIRIMPLTYEQWIKCGQSLAAFYQDNPERGLELWQRLTSGVSFKEGDDSLAAAKWASFSPDGGRSVGSLFHVAKEMGLRLPVSQAQKDRVCASFDVVEGGNEEPPGTWSMTAKGHLFTRNHATAVQYVNALGFATLSGEGLGKIVHLTHAANGRPSVNQPQEADFLRFFSTRSLSVFDEAKEKTTFINIGSVWLQTSHRREYKSIVFCPPEECDPDDLNLWTPIPCHVGSGDVTPLLDFLLINLCRNDKAKYNWLLDWSAHIIQKPQVKSPLVPVLISPHHGAGKGFFAERILGGILKYRYTPIRNADNLVERFNEAQSRMFLTVLDEVAIGKSDKISGVLKGLTGNPLMSVEDKYKSRITIKNYSRYLLTSNDWKNAVRMETGNRRYLPFDMDVPPDGTELFKNLFYLADHGRLCENFYGFLLERDISQLNPEMFPFELDNGGSALKNESAGSVGQFWIELLFERPAQLWEPYGDGRMKLTLSHVHAEFRDWIGGKTAKGYKAIGSFRADTQLLMPIFRWSDKGVEKTCSLPPSALRDNYKRTNKYAVEASFDDALYLIDEEKC
jgi:hypothetical protein